MTITLLPIPRTFSPFLSDLLPSPPGLVQDIWVGQLGKEETVNIEEMTSRRAGVRWAVPALMEGTSSNLEVQRFVMYSTRRTGWLVWVVALFSWTVSVYTQTSGRRKLPPAFYTQCSHILTSFVFIKTEALPQTERRALSPGVCPLTWMCPEPLPPLLFSYYN